MAAGLLLVACHGTPVDDVSAASVALIDLPRDCSKDVAALDNLLDLDIHQVCRLDGDCPCGMNCDDTSHCVAECVSDTDDFWRCHSPTQTCDNWGQCITPGPVAPPPSVLPALTLDATSITLDAPPDRAAWPTTTITVRLTSTDLTIGDNPDKQPKIRVHGGSALPVGCGDGSSATPCPIEAPSELEVACTAGAPFSASCELPAPWGFSVRDGVAAATRTVFVRPIQAARGKAWELRFSSEQAAGTPASVTIVRADAHPAELVGLYEGRLTLVGSSPGTPAVTAVPARAIVSGDTLLLLDDAHLVSPIGRLRFTRSGAAQRTSWLVNPQYVEVAAEVEVASLVQDPRTGDVTGGFSVRLPSWTAGAASKQSWHFDFHWVAPMPGASCLADSSCAAGSTCDSVLRSCVPGPHWEPLGSLAPYDAIDAPGLDVDGAAVASTRNLGFRDGTVDGAERLLCYDSLHPVADPNRIRQLDELELGGTVLGHTGELACASGNAPQALRLPLVRDVSSISRSVSDLFADCVTDLARPASDFSLRACVSLARTMPVLSLLSEPGHRNDRRAGLLLQHVVDGWLSVHATLAREGLELNRLNRVAPAQSQAVDVVQLLDQVAAGWNVVLDGRLGSALAGLPPAWLRTPDYRGTDRPFAYWATSDQDVEQRHLNLNAGDGSSSITFASDSPLARDLTVTFTTWLDRFKGVGTGVALDSPWLRVAFELPSGQVFEKGSVRDGASVDVGGLSTWIECMNWAVVQGGLAWSFDLARNGAGSHCRSYTSLGNRQQVPQDGSGTWSPGVHTGMLVPFSQPRIFIDTVDDNTDRPGPYSARRTNLGTASACQSFCSQVRNCTVWTFNKRTSVCDLKGDWGYQVEPISMPNPEVVSGMTALGHRIEARTAQYENNTLFNGTVYSTYPTAIPWTGCHEVCLQEAVCAGWSYEKMTQRCSLLSSITGSSSQPSTISSRRGGIDLLGSHRTSSGASFSFRTHLVDDQHLDPFSVTIQRRSSPGSYDVLTAPLVPGVPGDPTTPGSSAPPALVIWPRHFNFSEPPYWPGSGVLTVGRSGAFAPLSDVAIFDTPLDRAAIHAIEGRRGDGGTPVTRGALGALAGANHEQAVGLPVKMLATIEAELALLGGYLDGKQGTVASECLAHAATPTRDALLARAGDTLRRGALAASLADALHDRATQVACTNDSMCTSLGGRCGTHDERTIDALGMQRSGSITTCSPGAWSEPYGLCGGFMSTSYLAEMISGSATATFNVPADATYTFWGRLVARQDQSNSFWVRIDGNPWVSWEVPVEASAERDSWIWRRVGGSTPVNLALSAGPHTITVGIREEGTILRDLVVTRDLGSAAPPSRDDVCIDAQGVPFVQSTPWDEAYVNGRRAVSAATEALVDTVGRIEACRNPLGIEPGDLPLYFKDLAGSIARFFASSDYLTGLADESVRRAGDLFGQARLAWLNQRESQYQHDLSAGAAAARVELVASTFESPLSDLCGLSMATPGELLATLASGSIDPAACFVAGSPACRANFAGPVSAADPSCYRGQLGGSLLAMKEAAAKVAVMASDWTNKQAEYTRRSLLCVYKQGTEDIVKAHFDHMESLVAEKGLFDRIAMVASTAASVAVGFVSANPAALGTLINLPSAVMQLEVDDENAGYADEMARRSTAEDVMACWSDADTVRDDIETERLEIQQAIAELDAARLAFSEGRRRELQLITQGSVAVNRETGRTVVHPEFDYWVDSDMKKFQDEMVWARRLTYLSLLAVEYDFQTSVALRQKVLDAQDPDELVTVLRALKALQASYKVNGAAPQSKFVVLSLTTDILHLPGDSSERARELRELLRDHGQRIIDASGKVLGTGIRFSLTPDSAPVLHHRCAERVWSTTAQVAIDTILPLYRMPLRVLGDNTFSSQWCGHGAHETEMQTSSVRPAVNLFLPTSSVPFVEAPAQTACDIDAPVASSLLDLYRDAPPDGSVTDFAGHGLYATYALLFPANDASVDLSRIQEVYLRFDYLSVAAQ